MVCIEITGPPTRSPLQSNEEMVTKPNLYFQFGVQSGWVVFPSRRVVLVFDQPGHYVFFYEDDTLRGPNTGFELPLASIFA